MACDVMEIEQWYHPPSPKMPDECWSEPRGAHEDIAQVVGLSRIIRQVRDLVDTEVAEGDLALSHRFHEQSERWDRETAHLSSPLQRMMHPSYQAILGIAAESPEHRREVITLMLLDLKERKRDWLLALSYITQENPINLKDSGKIDKMTTSWLKWGEEHGYVGR